MQPRGIGRLLLVVAPLVPAAMLALWTWVSFSLNGGGWKETVSVISAGCLAYVIGVSASRFRDLLGPAVAAAVVGVFLAADGAFSGQPLAPPLEYGNANAALLVQGAAAAGLAVASRAEWVRAAALTGAGGVAALTLLTRSAAGVATGAIVVAAVAIAAAGRAPTGRKLAVCGMLLVAPPLLTVLIVTRPWLPGLDRATDVFSERRVALWTDAVALTTDNEWTGTGPGTFARMSPTAAADADTRAAHSASLEIGAEQGLVGVTLLAATVGAVALALRNAAGTNPGIALVGTAAWVTLWTHAAIDYVVDFPAVVMASALVVGLAAGSALDDEHRS